MELKNEVVAMKLRLSEVEMALMRLMLVVANQDKELPDFVKSIDEATELSKESSDMLTLLSNPEKAEA